MALKFGLFMSIAAHGALIAVLANREVLLPWRLSVAGGSGDGGRPVQVQLAPPFPFEPEAEAAPARREVPEDEVGPAPAAGPRRPPEDERAEPARALPPPVEAVAAGADPSSGPEKEPAAAAAAEPQPAPAAIAQDVKAAEPPAVPPRPAGEPAPAAIEEAGGEAGAEAPRVDDPLALRPRYPLSCRRRGHEGIAVITIQIGADGLVAAASVARSAGCPELDRAALDAVRQARFRPARVHGRPVPASIEQEFRFRLRD